MKSYGNKADNLQTLSEAGFEVPKFYKIDHSYSKKILNSKTQKNLSDSFKDWKIENNISSVAVRSSSTLEDSKEHSFAGQFETVLNVHAQEEFISSLIKVFGSKQKAGYVKESGQMYIVVQEFIEPDISGVSFTINPATGASEIVINFAAGRGTKVVEGKEAQQCVYNRITKKVHFNDDSATYSITKKMIDELVISCLKIETLFDYPQDIEWAIKDSKLYILQARPISTIRHLRLWDSSNIAESFPGIVLPLTFSIAKRGYLLGYKAQAYEGGLSWYEIEANNEMFDSMIGIFNGRMYYNLLSWYQYISLFPGSNKNQQFLDDQIATQGENIYQQPREFSTTYKLKYFMQLLYRAVFFKRELNKFYRQYREFEAKLKNMPQNGDPQLLMAQYSHIEQTIIPRFGRTLDNDFLVMTYHGWLKRLLNRWLPQQSFERNNIVGSISGVMSAKQATSLYELAVMFGRDSRASNLLIKKNYRALDQYLEGTSINDAMEKYIDTFGHRFAEDQKIESINPALEPHGMYKFMEVYIQLDTAGANDRIQDTKKQSRLIEGKVKSQLRFYQIFIYNLLLRKLKRHLRIREHNRLLRGKIYGYMRELFPKLGRALVDEEVIKKWDDIHYLRIEELNQILQGSLITNDLQERIKTRRQAYERFAKIEMPERFITKSLPSLQKVEQSSSRAVKTGVKSKISGLISSPGTIEGRVVVLTEPKIPEEPFDILVARHTDPGWTPLIALARGVIVEHGGMLSHAAIVTRELGIPSIIGVPNITTTLKTGMQVRINTQLSCVEMLQQPN